MHHHLYDSVHAQSNVLASIWYSWHILFDCEAVAYLRFHHMGQFFMEPSDYYHSPPQTKSYIWLEVQD
jgi:hypothetical protein